jgi:hypothetical protein
MSAYVVDRHHVIFLAKARSLLPESIHHEDPKQELKDAQMLWDENVKSVQFRYTSPPDGDFTITMQDIQNTNWNRPVDCVQVIKSIGCYEYQSCEHPGWKTSRAYQFCQSLLRIALNSVPGYDSAMWGAPAPTDHS